jgi:hypothetical protein
MREPVWILDQRRFLRIAQSGAPTHESSRPRVWKSARQPEAGDLLAQSVSGDTGAGTSSSKHGTQLTDLPSQHRKVWLRDILQRRVAERLHALTEPYRAGTQRVHAPNSPA